MTDHEFLAWLYDRLTLVYHENPNADFVLRLRRIVDSFAAPKPPMRQVRRLPVAPREPATMPLDGCWVCYDWTWPCDDCLRGRSESPKPPMPRRDSRSDHMERAHADAEPRGIGSACPHCPCTQTTECCYCDGTRTPLEDS